MRNNKQLLPILKTQWPVRQSFWINRRFLSSHWDAQFQRSCQGRRLGNCFVLSTLLLCRIVCIQMQWFFDLELQQSQFLMENFLLFSRNKFAWNLFDLAWKWLIGFWFLPNFFTVKKLKPNCVDLQEIFPREIAWEFLNELNQKRFVRSLNFYETKVLVGFKTKI